jgi:transposase
VRTVALQSTGVYWIPLYDILEERGFDVNLVNARHTKNLPGRKSDVQESQWLLKLHTYGLLNNFFQPPSKIRVLHTYWRRRTEHVTGAATCEHTSTEFRTPVCSAGRGSCNASSPTPCYS